MVLERKLGTQLLPQGVVLLLDMSYPLDDSLFFLSQCELYHWIDILDRFDEILAGIAKPVEGKTWLFVYDMLEVNLGAEEGVSSYKILCEMVLLNLLSS